MTGQSSSSADTERRTDGGDVSDSGLDPDEMEDHPAETVYRNVREMGEDMSRRQFLALAALGGAGYTAWTTDIDGDGVANGEELLHGRNPVAAGGDGGGAAGETTPDEEPVRERALAYAEDEFPAYRDRVASFVADEDVSDAFIDRQLELWLAAPDRLEQGVHMSEDRTWQEAIISAVDGFYMDDWTKNGMPHLEPDGTPGPAYESPFVVNPDSDAIMPRFYNATGKVHDVRSGEYRGFEPGNGDKVGKLGDEEGRGSIAAYLDGVSRPEELTGHRVTALWYDWMEGDGHSNRLRSEAVDVLQELFAAAPVDSPDGSSGIDIRFIEGEQIPHQNTIGADQLSEYLADHMPEVLQGPVNYVAAVHLLDPLNPDDEKGPGGTHFYAQDTDAAYFYHHPDTAGNQVGMIQHELYGHNIGGIPHTDNEGSVMNPNDSVEGYATFVEEEWQRVIRGLTPREQEYYSPIGTA